MCCLWNKARCDYQEKRDYQKVWLPDRRLTDRQSDPYVPLCFAGNTINDMPSVYIENDKSTWRICFSYMNGICTLTVLAGQCNDSYQSLHQGYVVMVFGLQCKDSLFPSFDNDKCEGIQMQ